MFIGVVIVLAPLAAVVVSCWDVHVFAASTLFLSMVGAEVFGVINHLIVPGADNWHWRRPAFWGNVFVWSALALAAIEAAGIVVGALRS